MHQTRSAVWSGWIRAPADDAAAPPDANATEYQLVALTFTGGWYRLALPKLAGRARKSSSAAPGPFRTASLASGSPPRAPLASRAGSVAGSSASRLDKGKEKERGEGQREEGESELHAAGVSALWAVGWVGLADAVFVYASWWVSGGIIEARTFEQCPPHSIRPCTADATYINELAGLHIHTTPPLHFAGLLTSIIILPLSYMFFAHYCMYISLFNLRISRCVLSKRALSASNLKTLSDSVRKYKSTQSRYIAAR